LLGADVVPDPEQVLIKMVVPEKFAVASGLVKNVVGWKAFFIESNEVFQFLGNFFLQWSRAEVR
jgi:hypothetical protein